MLVGGLFFLTLGAALVVLKWPELVFNSKNMEQLARYAASHWIDPALKLDWKSLSFQLESASIFKKTLSLSLGDVCVQFQPISDGEGKVEGTTRISGCSEQVKVRLVADLSGLTSLGTSEWVGILPMVMSGGPIEIKDLRWTAASQGNPNLYGVVNLQGASIQNGQAGQSGKLYPFQIKVQTQLTKADDSSIGSAMATPSVKVDLTLNMTDKAWKAQISANARNWLREIPGLEMRACEFEFPSLLASGAKKSGGSVQTACRLQVELSNELQSPVPIDLPKYVPVELRADLAFSSFPPDSDSRVHGPVELNLLPLHLSGVNLKGHFKSQIAGMVSSILEGIPASSSDPALPDHAHKGPVLPWHAETDFNVEASVKHFGKLVRHLEQVSLKNWDPSEVRLSVVPAPFHVLKGAMNLKLKGHGDLNSGSVALDLKSQLKSQGQVCNLNGAGNFGLKHLVNGWAPELNLDLLFANVQLELPRLALGSPPRFLPDSRIEGMSRVEAERLRAEKVEETLARKNEVPRRGNRAGVAGSRSPSFKYNIALHTAPGRPIRILSHLARAPIPVNIDLKVNSETPLGGTIQVDGFPFQFLRRDAVIEQFRIRLGSPIDQSPVFGNVAVKYADYQVLIQLVGTVEKPQVLLKSEPPLPENQIVAVLLFGRPLDELDPDQSASVGSTRAAMADGAISLASLYILASTPIQSVNYDPSSGLVSAKVRLAEGTSLNLGKSTDESTVGIRKRLGRYWTIETDYSNSTPSGNVGTAYLEWSHRY